MHAMNFFETKIEMGAKSKIFKYDDEVKDLFNNTNLEETKLTAN